MMGGREESKVAVTEIPSTRVSGCLYMHPMIVEFWKQSPSLIITGERGWEARCQRHVKDCYNQITYKKRL